MRPSTKRLLWVGAGAAVLVWLGSRSSTVTQLASEATAKLLGEPRGYRNNNPGNLKPPTATTYHGQIGLDPDGFAIFGDPVDGLRALMLNAEFQFSNAGATTLNKLGAIWAPVSDHNAASYGAELADQIFGNTSTIDAAGNTVLPGDYYFNPVADFIPLAKAISINENGYWKYDDTTVSLANDNALAYLGMA